jgi:hypothetical protein
VLGLSRNCYNIKLKLCEYLREKLTDSAKGERDNCAMDLVEETESLQDFV